MKAHKTLAAKVGSNEITKAAGPRRPLRKPPGKPIRPSSPAKPAGNKPAQPTRPARPADK